MTWPSFMASSRADCVFGRGAVDFVGQQNVGEYRAALEFELLLDGGIDGDAQHVGGQHVAGELHALKLQSRARARAWPSVVLPTPGTPSISRWPRAKIETSARRTTSSLPRMTLRSAVSSCTARWEAAVAVSGDIRWRFYYARVAAESVTNVMALSF